MPTSSDPDRAERKRNSRISISRSSSRRASDKRIDPLRADLIELLKEDAVDLIDLERAPPRLKYNVVKEGEALVGEDDSTEFEVKAMNEYFDFRPLERRYFEKMKERIESGEYGK